MTSPSPISPRPDHLEPPRGLSTFEELLRPFALAAPQVDLVTAEEMPPAAAALLAHQRHMTVTLERRLGSSVDLEVLAAHHHEPHYSRCIRLTSSRTGELGLFGVMRFDFRSCSTSTREQILAGGTPLGRILIASGALRTVHLHRLIRVPDAAATLRQFASRRGSSSRSPAEDAPSGFLWGRLASIHCDGEPAVDLVEILSPHLCETPPGAADAG